MKNPPPCSYTVVTQHTVTPGMEMEKSQSRCPCPSLTSLQSSFLTGISKLFEKHGKRVARHPIRTILSCVLLTLLSTIGFLNFNPLSDRVSLWIPAGSETRENTEWLNSKYPPDVRYQSIIIKGKDILTPEGVRAIFNISMRLDSLRTETNSTWQTECKKVAIPTRNPLNYLAWIFGNDDNILGLGCDDQLTMICLELNLINQLLLNDSLPDQEFVDSLNRTEILRRVNLAQEEDIREGTTKVQKFLGNLVFDEEGKVTGAGASKILLISETNITEALLHPMPSHSSPVTNASMIFEERLKDDVLTAGKELEGFEVSVFVHRGFDDVVNENILGNYNLLFSGFAIMFVYVLIMLGKFNCVEQRIWLSIAGLSGVVLGSVFCLGICSACGLMFTQLHNVLPFLMLGIGIDDMFVLVQSYENLTKEERNLSLEERFGKALSYAGMAVSVTSVTNIVAFTLGATTVIPALRSFCLFCSVGIFAIFIYTLTFFTACMVVDQRRIDEKRDGCLVCIRHGPDWKPNELTRKNLVNCFFAKLAEVMTQNMVSKLFVSGTAILLFGLSCYGITQLEQRFEERWLIPDDSYLAKWFDDRELYFMQGGERGTIYFAEIELTNDQLDRIQILVRSLTDETKYITEVDQWAVQFSNKFHNGSLVDSPDEKLALSVNDSKVDNTAMIRKLGQYLRSPEGLEYRDRFVFENNSQPSCVEENLPPLVMFKIEFQHPLFSGPTEHVPAMERVKELVKEAGIKGRVFARADKYEFWEVDGILSVELYRSIILALTCVFFIVIFMLANVIGALLVLLCVIFTLVDVMGFMYFWGLTVDTTTSMLLIVCIGLSVDYAAHIAHGFLEEEEEVNLENRTFYSKLERNRARAQATLTKIGPAVLYGGLSTMLATILLAFSDYYLFIAFFKVFLLVVTFGLFHGLVFLPVLLCLVGPSHPPRKKAAMAVELEVIKNGL